MSQTISCKMCGGSLMLRSGLRIAECEFCGTLQTIPLIDDEKKLRKFERANRLRRNKEFDKASGIYESIVDDCPEEAEAYWGMVLCRFGIEYVDDPATGKKVPTCHRTSFTTVMEDEDCQQAMENSSGEARKLYRAEATQIEELRKKIIEVSSQTEPFDIFICYKETDDRGSRTVDSLLAQDIYDMLTREGYRVFFSRITLEDKLGSEYEPLIFSALNSSKIMLAVGTDYDHFDAVWVKNEWSRFLKLMTQDNTKTLIPCYKGITPNDFPAEFAKLQAQDLGKVGAMQDLLRGIEKILPKKTIQPPIPGGGKVVGGIEIQTLLDRAQFALEDKNWSDALKFCEQILNKDARNGRAYLYKLLAGETCGSLGELVRKRLDATQHGRKEEALYPADEQYIQQAVEIYSIPNFTIEDEIRELYKTEIHYQTEVPSRVAQKNKEASFWTTNILLVRAENFADPALKKDIQTAKKAALAEMDKRIRLAREDEVATIAQAQAEYQKFLQEADLRTQEYHAKVDAERARMYKEQKSQLFLMLNTKDLSDLAEMFQKLGDFKDSISYNLKCLNRIAKIEKIKRILKIIRNILLILLVGAIILGFIYSDKLVEMFIEPQRQQEEFRRQYSEAQELLNAGEYESAIEIFKALGDFKDSAQKLIEAESTWDELCEQKYLDAQNLLSIQEPYRAAMLLGQLGDYRDAREISMKIWKDLTSPVVLSVSMNRSVAIQQSGSVLTTAGGHLQDLEGKNVESISAGDSHTIALLSGGAVIGIGSNNYGACNVDTWRDIVAISTNTSHTVGLKTDGTVVTAGNNAYGQCDVQDWQNIIAVSAGYEHTVALRSDGSVVACGNNRDRQCNVDSWYDIIAVSAGYHHTVGLRADGTVVATGETSDGQCDVSSWTDIIAIAAGHSITVGLKSDGTVVATGNNEYGQCDVSNWTDIVAIATDMLHTVGIKRDGTAIAVGNSYNGRCDVSEWTEIFIPD